MRHLALALLVLVASAGTERPASADGELREDVVAHNLDVKLKIPASFVYDAARLGHVVMPARVTITNTGANPVPLDPKGVRMRARGTLAAYACEPRSPTDRWPTQLAPGETITSERAPSCETTLPGRYDLELRWAGQPDSDPPVAVSAFTIEPGASPPVPLASRRELVATVTGSKEVRPSNDPGVVRIILGIVNAGPSITSLSPLVVDTTLRQVGKTFSCHDRRTIELSGLLRSGQIHTVWMPLACAVPYEGDWETTVEVGEPKTRMVRLQKHVVHVEPTEDVMHPSPTLPTPR